MKTLALEEWITLDRRNPGPTFFARPAWARAIAHEYPSLEPSPLVSPNDVLVPTMKTAHARLPFREHIAFPLGGYTAFLDAANRPVDAAAATRAVRALSSVAHHARFIPWPLAPMPSPKSGSMTRTYETAVIDCVQGYETALAGVRGVTRRMAGQAQRRGVICVRSGSEGLDRYYGMLREASVGWGLPRPPISRALLEAVFNYGGDDAQLWFAQLDGEAIGGGVVLLGADELFFWSAAMRRDFSKYRPSNALNLRLIQLACERGVRWYNLGASEGLDGVARFKHDLGARGIAYNEITVMHPAFALYERMKNGVRHVRRTA